MAINNHRWGIAAGVLACALWGLVFLAPELTPGFTALQLSAGRYLAYGLVAVVLIAPSWRRLAGQLTGREWRGLVWLGLTGNLVYYVLLANAVQLGGVAMTSLVIGLLPVIVTLVGARDRHAVPLRRLAPSLALSLAGLVCISWQSLAAAQQPGQQSVAGLLCALGALLSWTAYVVANSRWLGKLHAVSAHEWSLLTGVVTGAMALVLAVPAFLPDLASTAPHVKLGATAWMIFAGVVIGVAVLCSVIGNGLCFNVESIPELHRLNAVAGAMGKTARVSLRVNPNVDAKTHPYIATGLKASKFGVAFDDALATYRTAAGLPHLQVAGIDCHIGSQLLDDAPLLEALDRLIELIDQLGTVDGVRAGTDDRHTGFFQGTGQRQLRWPPGLLRQQQLPADLPHRRAVPRRHRRAAGGRGGRSMGISNKA